MALVTEPHTVHRPPSPWTGSQHQTRHRWQLEHVRSLEGAATALQLLAAELRAADAAGWWLVEPMASGHLLAARASRRQRAGRSLGPLGPPSTDGAPPLHGWRLRLIDEPPLAGEGVLDTATAGDTPVLASTRRGLAQVSGLPAPSGVLAELTRQLAATELGHRRWALASARVGVGFDLVADGSALRAHAVVAGVLMRTREVLTFQHAADGARTLRQAAAAYERLAVAAAAMAAAGGRLSGADDGFLHVEYDGLVP